MPARSTRAISSLAEALDSSYACSPTPCAGGCAAPRVCRRGWRGAGDTRTAWCSRRRHSASGSRRPRRGSCDVDYQPGVSRSRAGLPGALKRAAQQRVELAHVPEREHPQERPQHRGRRHPAAGQPPCGAGPQHGAIVDAVGAQPGQSRRNPTSRPASASIPAAPPASRPTSLRRPKRPAHRRSRPARHPRSFFIPDRTEPAYRAVDAGQWRMILSTKWHSRSLRRGEELLRRRLLTIPCGRA